MEVNGSNIKQKLSNKYCCEKCKYITNRKSNFNNHILSAKHLMEINGSNIKQKLSNNFCCEKCNKIYKTHAGLWKHKQKCNIIVTVSNAETFDKDQLIIMLIKQNAELIKETSGFKTAIMEQQNIIII